MSKTGGADGPVLRLVQQRLAGEMTEEKTADIIPCIIEYEVDSKHRRAGRDPGGGPVISETTRGKAIQADGIREALQGGKTRHPLPGGDGPMSAAPAVMDRPIEHYVGWANRTWRRDERWRERGFPIRDFTALPGHNSCFALLPALSPKHHASPDRQYL